MLFRTFFLARHRCLVPVSADFRHRQDIVASSDLETTFDMIGGLGDLRDEIMDIVSLARSSSSTISGAVGARW